MKHRVIGVVLGFLLLTGCSIFRGPVSAAGNGGGAGRTSPAGNKVVETGKRLSFDEKRIFRGSCWDFVTGVYQAAGYPDGKRQVIFRREDKGAYADPGILEPGDWVLHYNLEFGNVDHSSIFIDWIDRDQALARTLDHAGMNRPEPGRYREHRMTKIFMIMRARD